MDFFICVLIEQGPKWTVFRVVNVVASVGEGDGHSNKSVDLLTAKVYDEMTAHF